MFLKLPAKLENGVWMLFLLWSLRGFFYSLNEHLHGYRLCCPFTDSEQLIAEFVSVYRDNQVLRADCRVYGVGGGGNLQLLHCQIQCRT